MRSQIIEQEIEFWQSQSSYYSKYFNTRLAKGLIKLCEVIPETEPGYAKLITDYISGITLLPFWVKSQNEAQGQEFDALTKPVFDYLINHIKSEEYQKYLINQEISGKAILNAGGVTIPISSDEMLLQIKRSKIIPIVPKDIALIEREWLAYKRKQYEDAIKTQDSERFNVSPSIEEKFETSISEIQVQENKFWKGLPMDQVVNHFKVMTVRKNKNNEVFLTKQQLISFLKRGFLKDTTQPKQKINCANGEKGFVIKRFYELFELATAKHGYPMKKARFIEMFNDCFDNWDPKTVSPLFKPNKTKEKW